MHAADSASGEHPQPRLRCDRARRAHRRSRIGAGSAERGEIARSRLRRFARRICEAPELFVARSNDDFPADDGDERGDRAPLPHRPRAVPGSVQVVRRRQPLRYDARLERHRTHPGAPHLLGDPDHRSSLSMPRAEASPGP